MKPHSSSESSGGSNWNLRTNVKSNRRKIKVEGRIIRILMSDVTPVVNWVTLRETVPKVYSIKKIKKKRVQCHFMLKPVLVTVCTHAYLTLGQTGQ